MDCCKYGEYRAGPAQYPGAGAPWEGYCAPMPYAPYAHAYYAHAHDPYARYYRYNYPVHHPHSEHVLPMDYAYASKEVRMRRALSRRERPLLPAQHPHTLTPPLECGMNGRGSTYCEPPMWPHYQMGALGSGGWNGSNPTGGSWSSRSSCSREHARYPTDCRQVKGPQIHTQNQACLQEGRSTPYRAYEDSLYNGESTVRQGSSPEYPTACATPSDPAKVRSRFYPEPRRSPPEEKRPPLVPLPAFQQAFGSTEIGKFAEAFSRTEVALDEASDNFPYESFPEWDVTPEPQWSSQPASREIKCEDNY